MAVAIWKTGTSNAVTTTLNGSITDSDTTIALTSTTGLQYPGVVLIDRVDANDVETPLVREYVSYTGISGNSLTGCDRSGLGGSTAQSHSSGAKVEEVWSITHWNDFLSTFDVEHGTDGTHDDMTSHVTAASLTAAGKVEIATAAETTTGTDATRAVSPDGLAGSDYGKRVVGIEVIAPDTDTSTGDGKAFFRIPSTLNGYNLVAVAANVYTAGTTNTTDVQIRNVTDSQDMLSTKITIDSGETDTSTAATAAVINTTYDDVATGDKIAIDIDAVSTTAAKGLYVELTFQLP